MTDSEKAQALAMARLLRAAGSIDWLATVVTVLAAAAASLAPTVNLPCALAAVVLGVAAKIYGFRIAFDAGLFEDLGRGALDLPRLDDALSSLGLRKRTANTRSLGDRCRGARGLIVTLVCLTLASALALITSVL